MVLIISKPLYLLNPELVIKESSSNAELVELMCNTQVGIGFVNRHMGLPQNTFVSNDAIRWFMNNIKTFNSRSKTVQRLQVTFKYIFFLGLYQDG